MTKELNYTPEMTAAIVEGYKNGVAIETLATQVGRTARSVIAKLVQTGDYVAKTRAKAGKQATKAQLVTQLELQLEVREGALASLEKADRAALETLVEAVTNYQAAEI